MQQLLGWAFLGLAAGVLCWCIASQSEAGRALPLIICLFAEWVVVETNYTSWGVGGLITTTIGLKSWTADNVWGPSVHVENKGDLAEPTHGWVLPLDSAAQLDEGDSCTS